MFLMKTIDHDPNEKKNEEIKFPDHLREWMKEDYPNGATPWDLLFFISPVLGFALVAQITRYGWPF